MQTRFMHTSDWQLGVTRQFLNADSQARWAEARFEGIRNLGRTAQEEKCEFIVVAGDDDLLSLGRFRGVEIMSVATAVRLITQG